jgi:hypothetical protein
MFIFIAQAFAYFFYLSILVPSQQDGIPNNHLCWVCISSWGFHWVKLQEYHEISALKNFKSQVCIDFEKLYIRLSKFS